MKKQMFAFIKRLILIALPIVLQQLFLNFASLLDTLMVGQLDEISISGVYVATQIVFVFNMMMFGTVEGASVFFSQYFGTKDEEHMRKCYALKYVLSISFAIVGMVVLFTFGRDIASLFVSTEAELDIAVKYLNIVISSSIPFALTVTLSSTLRESHKTFTPMIITFIGIMLNLLFNYLFIYGIWPFPQLGGVGAAIGTFINRIVEMTLLVLIVLIKKEKFNKNLFHSFKIEKDLLKKIIKKSIPLFLNETLWSLSQFTLVYFFSKSDPLATTVLPIVTTIFNLLFVVMLGVGQGVSILVANSVGESKFETAQKEAYYSLIITVIVNFVLGAVLFICSDLIVSLYSGVGLQAREIASYLIKFDGIYLLVSGINLTLFFLLRAGGKTEIVFLFDSCFCWLISIPFAIVLVNFTNMDFKTLYVLVYSIEIIKAIVGMILLLSKKWYKNLVVDSNIESVN